MKKKQLKATDLIRAQNTDLVLKPAGEKALAELRAVLEHNDALPLRSSRRINWRQTVEMLQSYKWEGRTLRDLDRVCVDQLLRASYLEP